MEASSNTPGSETNAGKQYSGRRTQTLQEKKVLQVLNNLEPLFDAWASFALPLLRTEHPVKLPK